ncbi:hypothetical protein [Pseudomonas capsici]|uniref:hypothetical protein n=1 Tax=Pseudomonas capsici TaxID=2810614 RepID=UPI0021F1E373|nr:hypothetical protein [Pseudomonas capsici]MCV4286264.1 hypothetical protein [Pseudomonas capsici]
MNFDLLQHEIDALKFYQNLIGTTEDAEIKKAALSHHASLLKDLIGLETEMRKAKFAFENALEKNSNAIELERLKRGGS